MRLRTLFGGISMLCACSSSSDPMPSNVFRLCKEQPGIHQQLEIDYRNLSGLFDDVRFTPTPTCGDEADACIAYPIDISVPPTLPTAGRPVRWTVDNFHFTASVADRPHDYVIESIELRPDESGRPTLWDRWRMTYSERRGLARAESPLSDESWSRCAGRLTFDDLRQLTSRIHRSRTAPAAPPADPTPR